MALSVKVGSMAQPTTGTPPIDQTSVSLGFTPKIVFFWANYMTADGNTTNARSSFGVAATAAKEWVVAPGSGDAQTASATRTKYDNTRSVMLWNETAQTTQSQAEFKSMNADDFTITWLTAIDATARVVNWMALGGTDITNVDVGSFTLPSGAVAKSITTPGFSPDFILFSPTGQNAAPPVNLSHAKQSISFTTSTNAIRCTGIRDGNGLDPMNNWTQQITDKAGIVILDAGTLDSHFTVTSILSTGFEITRGDAGTSLDYVLYACIKGGSHKIGTATQPVSGGTPQTQDVTGIGFTPAGVMLLSSGQVSDTAVRSHIKLSLGGASGVANRSCITYLSTDAVGTSEANQALDQTKVLKMMTAGVGAGAPTTEAEADVAATPFASDKFSLSWTTIDATAREFYYWAFGDTATTPTAGPHTKKIMSVRPPFNVAITQ